MNARHSIMMLGAAVGFSVFIQAAAADPGASSVPNLPPSFEGDIPAGAMWRGPYYALDYADVDVAMSANGAKRVVVVKYGPILTSTDSGVTWTRREIIDSWISAASSADGTKLVAVAEGGQIYTSIDAGENWTARENSRTWKCVASSADGNKLVAVAANNQIFTSVDAGVNWTPRGISGNWLSVASSADGTILVATVYGGQLFISTNAGVTWNPREENRNWVDLASSADGSKMVALDFGGRIYTSTDTGATWTPRENDRVWRSVASSADGNVLIASEFDDELFGSLYISTNAGVTWIRNTNGDGIRSVVSSADGKKFMFSLMDGSVYSSSTAFSDLFVPANRIQFSRTNFVRNISAGSVDESWQTLNFMVTNTATNLFLQQPSISVNGTLTFTPAINASGTATVSVELKDNGGTANGGVDTSAPLTFNITILPNQAPSFAALPSVVAAGRDQGLFTQTGFATNFVAGASNETWQTLTFVVTNSATNLFLQQPSISTNGTLTFTPAGNGTGTATVTVVLKDDGGTANGGVDTSAPQTFTIIIVPGIISTPNQPPRFEGDFVAWTATQSTGIWLDVASSADGTKLVALDNNLPPYIYTSTDSGVNWTPRESPRDWQTVASSADGIRLVAAVLGGQIYTSTDAGVNWTARETERMWVSVASSADGTSLAAVDYGGQIYTSTNSGVNWTARDTNRLWSSVASSADGTRLAAVVNGGQNYISTNAGVAWTARETNRNWQAVASSSDGNSLVAAVSGGQIYTSTDGGATWTARETNRNWSAVASSADGTRLAAVVNGGQIYTSTDAGASWMAGESERKWFSVASTADGKNLVAAGFETYIYVSRITLFNPVVEANKQPFTRPNFAQNISAGPTNESWQSVTFIVTNDATHLFLQQPSISYNGTLTFTPSVYVSGTATVTVVLKDNGGTLGGGVDTSAPQTFTITVNPTVNQAPSFAAVPSGITAGINQQPFTQSGFATNISAGPEYENGQSLTFVVTNNATNLFLQQPSISANGTLMFSPAGNTTGTATVTVVLKDDGGTANGGVDTSAPQTFTITVIVPNQPPSFEGDLIAWYATENNRDWSSVASSADGTKLVAVVGGGQIYTSTNSGLDWTARQSTRYWSAVASSADGTKLVAVVGGGQIYTSTNSGLNWTARESPRSWQSVASSADGTRLVAGARGGQIYTSTDAGVTWTARASSRQWQSVASSADGTRLVAGDYGGRIYTSTNSGLDWTARESSRNWQSVASSADGIRLVAAVDFGQIYTSTDAGVTWTAWESTPEWRSVASSADGTRLVAAGIDTKISVSYPVLFHPVVDANNQPFTRANFAYSISAGPSNESWQTVTFVVTNNATNLFLQQPAISPDGILTFTPAVNARGIATVTVLIKDNGGTSSGGMDTSAPKTFTITVNPPINQAPEFEGEQENLRMKPRGISKNWRSVASSADGITLYAVPNGGQLYASSDTGLNWSPPATGNREWLTVACSSNGFYVLAAAINLSNNRLFYLWNRGASGEVYMNFSNLNWRAVAMSADGTKLVAVTAGAQIYTSTNSGTNWIARESNREWVAVASSADANTLVAAVNSGYIYVSTNAGITWMERAMSKNWRAVASSADGAKLVAAASEGQIYTSADRGETWTPRETNRNWTSVASSADGTRLFAGVWGGQLYVSSDGGATWIPREKNRNWQSVASSADGNKLAAVDYGGFIYTSSPGLSNLVVLADMTPVTRASFATNITVGPSYESWQTVSFVVTNNATNLFIQQPSISTNGTLTFTPAANVSGTATVTVVLKDNGGTESGGDDASSPGTFTITIIPPTNTAPSFAAVPSSVTTGINQGPFTQTGFATNISAGASNEFWQTLTFVVTNNAANLFIEQPSISTNGTLTFTPAGNVTGTATVTIVLMDDGGTANGGVDATVPVNFTIVLQYDPASNGGISISWFAQYGLSATNRFDAVIPGGGATFAEAYAYDHNPNTAAPANFNRIVPAPLGPGGSTMTFTVDPSSTNRIYDVFRTTNLMNQLWTSFGLDRSGNGSALTLTVTNSGAGNFYRTGARVP